MSYACERCVKRLGIGRAPRYATIEELQRHEQEAHPARPSPTDDDIQEALTGSPPSSMPVPVEVPLRKLVDELLSYARDRAVPGPAGEDYRSILVKARELGLLRR